jgi:hypothetical protein
MTTWYKQCMPKIKDIAPHISSLFEELKKEDNVKGIYIWGSYSKNINKPSFRVKDIDIICRTKYHSLDLISINDDIIKELITDNYLEKQGYDPATVKFSKKFIGTKKYNVDHWIISGDRKLLHWGAILEKEAEQKEINNMAEEYVIKKTGLNRNKLNRSSENSRKNWYELYSNYINKNFENMPTGWYKVEDMRIKDILKNAIKI